MIGWSSDSKFYAADLPQLIEIFVLPNIKINEEIKEEFDEDSDRFLEQFFLGTDMGSKRFMSIDLMKAIIRYYPQEFEVYMFNLFENSIQKGLSIGEESALIGLVTDMAADFYRAQTGCTKLTINESIVVNCYKTLLKPKFEQMYQWALNHPEIVIEHYVEPILVAAQLRFVCYFRKYIAKDELPVLLGFVGKLVTDHRTLRNIVYMTAEALVTVKHEKSANLFEADSIPYFTPMNMEEQGINLLKMIYYNELKEPHLNDNLASLFYSTLGVIKQLSVKYSEVIINIIQSLLNKAEVYEFKTLLNVCEGFGLFVFWMVDRNEDVTNIESLLNAFLNKYISSQSDIVNFILQIYAIILTLKNNLAPIYQSIYDSVTDIKNWDSNNFTLFSAYAFYTACYMKKYP